MKLAVDVDYRDDRVSIAGLAFSRWEDAQAAEFFHSTLNKVEDYQPGQFYRREMPAILHLLDEHKLSPDIIVIDGYVSLGREQKPGLGRHLYNALQGRIPVIGVAKNPFRDTTTESEACRGSSRRPLYVTSAGIGLEEAKQSILSMHGKYRLPTLLKEADRLCRENRPRSSAKLRFANRTTWRVGCA